MRLPIRDSSLFATIDDCDAAQRRRVWRLSGGYVVASDGRQLGRILVGLPRGDRREVDHRNGDKLDNRRANLRVCTKAQNGQNRGVNCNSSTGARGVTSRRGRFRARVQVDGVMHSLGSFDTVKAAAEVAAEFRARHYEHSRN